MTGYTVIERIVQDIEQRLLGIQLGAGWPEAVRVERVKLPEGNDPLDDGLIVIAQEDDAEMTPEADGTFELTEWVEPITIIAYARVAEYAEVPIDTRLNHLRGAIEKRLMDDRQRNNLAWDSRIVRCRRDIADDLSVAWVELLYRVRYRTEIDDPWQKQ